ncbi:MAG: hypothetical protein WC516_05985 [Patescibacteria group bacterium]
MNKFLEFKQVPYEGKTKRFEVMSVKHGYSLGRISWYGSWRQYVFSPAFETIWNKDCLKDIQDFLKTLMREHKLNNRSKPDYITTDDLT